jgi:hypothetical protein
VTIAVKYEFIYQKQVRYSVSDQCRVLEVSRSGYYAWRRQEIPKRQRENWELLKRSRALYTQYRGRCIRSIAAAVYAVSRALYTQYRGRCIRSIAGAMGAHGSHGPCSAKGISVRAIALLA